ncbi:MAG TPA: DUF2070 family protein, partial [Thermoprotei archaeon]|nr:DUF2070 family protein [Thermoprotei archaeon]
MSNENTVENIKSHYNLIFSFPSFKIILILFTAVTFLFTFTISIFIKNYTLNLISFIFIVSIFLQIIFSKKIAGKILTLRRLLAFYVIILSEAIIVIFLLKLFNRNQIYARFLISITPFYAFNFLLNTVFSKKRELSLGLSFLTFLPLLLVVNKGFINILAASLFIFLIIIIILFLKHIDVGGRNILKVNGLDLFYGFINIFLVNDAEYMEKLFSEHLYKKYRADFYIIYFLSLTRKIIGC